MVSVEDTTNTVVTAVVAAATEAMEPVFMGVPLVDFRRLGLNEVAKVSHHAASSDRTATSALMISSPRALKMRMMMMLARRRHEGTDPD